MFWKTLKGFTNLEKILKFFHFENVSALATIDKWDVTHKEVNSVLVSVRKNVNTLDKQQEWLKKNPRFTRNIMLNMDEF